ncbi:unnamed protein product [Prorocentrum cordatum]|uniref:Uncharacterized protein n=1 Tax=Prorocentrum cordatum TaxID=2364126 RepID=A0ABN9RA79_9DINO|nr:unnamed protein product [Polarella glacialis]
MVHDRRLVPPVGEKPAVAAYVDGAAAIGEERGAVDRAINAIHRQLEADGLICKGVSPPGLDQKFTGLTFDSNSGRVSPSAARPWRPRLGLRAGRPGLLQRGPSAASAGTLQLGRPLAARAP